VNNIETMNFKAVKEYLQSVDSVDEDIINLLKADKRKNVNALGDKLQRDAMKAIEELARIKSMYTFDRDQGVYAITAGVDEVGRGPLAGPIVAAAVVLDLYDLKDENLILGIKDSKKLSAKKREELDKLIKERAVSYAIGIADNNEIDEKGIAWCNNEVFKRAIKGLKVRPDLVISDGFPVSGIECENKYYYKGDNLSISIAAASIIAKVFRDEIMQDYHKKYPNYNFEANVGYGTEEHVRAIKMFGITPIHRMSFLKNILY